MPTEPFANAVRTPIAAGGRTFQRLFVPELESTHRCLVQHGRELASGTVLVAGHQSAGEGRQGRAWTSPPGKGLLFSLLLKEPCPASEHPLLTHLAALAIAETLRQLGLDAAIEWPNDIVVEGGKIAGILAEASLTGQRLDYAVISAGINVDQDASELATIDIPAASIRSAGGPQISPGALLERILASFVPLHELFLSHGFAALAAQWRARLSTPSGTVAVETASGRIEGNVCGYGDDGSLLLKPGDGSVSRIYFGEVLRLRAPCHRNREAL